jgi:hypothetical protein
MAGRAALPPAHAGSTPGMVLLQCSHAVAASPLHRQHAAHVDAGGRPHGCANWQRLRQREGATTVPQ